MVDLYGESGFYRAFSGVTTGKKVQDAVDVGGVTDVAKFKLKIEVGLYSFNFE
jgi:hypothetical protein